MHFIGSGDHAKKLVILPGRHFMRLLTPFLYQILASMIGLGIVGLIVAPMVATRRQNSVIAIERTYIMEFYHYKASSISPIPPPFIRQLPSILAQ